MAINVDKAPKYRLFPSYRLVITGMLFGIASLLYANFSSMNFTITCMVNSTADTKPSSVAIGECTLNESATNHSKSDNYNGHLLWNRDEQSIVLAANAIGTVASVFIAGYFTDKYGARYVGLLSCFFFTITALTMPIATHAGWKVVTVVRVVQGMGVIATWPVYLMIATQWFPVQERGMLTAIGASGNQIGSIFANLVASYCCKSSIGWPMYFYVIGAISGAFTILWFCFYTDHVESARFISKSEVLYIVSCRENTGRHHISNNKSIATDSADITADMQRPNVKTPWGHIVRSPVIWSLMVVSFGTYYVFFFIGDYMPTYYKESLGIDVAESGILSALPSIAQFFGRVSAGPIGDRLDRAIGRNKTIKIMTAIAGYGPAVMLAASTAFDCHTAVGAVVFLTAAYFCFGYVIAGCTRAAMLVSPGFVGTISGMCMTSYFIGALVAPYISGAIIGQGSIDHWHHAFYASAGIGAFGTTVFMIFGSGDPQSWGVIEDESSESNKIDDPQYKQINENFSSRQPPSYAVVTEKTDSYEKY